jgi:hypothetical protein
LAAEEVLDLVVVERLCQQLVAEAGLLEVDLHKELLIHHF